MKKKEKGKRRGGIGREEGKEMIVKRGRVREEGEQRKDKRGG